MAIRRVRDEIRQGLKSAKTLVDALARGGGHAYLTTTAGEINSCAEQSPNEAGHAPAALRFETPSAYGFRYVDSSSNNVRGSSWSPGLR